MNDQTLRAFLRRLNALERTSARVRVGEVTDVNPLDVALGGSDTSYENVKALAPVKVGDQVATLLWGNDLLVLGPIAGGAPIHFIGSGDGVAPAFTNSWVNFDNSAATPGGGTNRDAGFYKDGGRVWLTGMIKAGASGTTAFTLPAGYQPKALVECAVFASPALPVFLLIGAGGTVQPTNVGASAVTTFVFLDGASFIAA